MVGEPPRVFKTHNILSALIGNKPWLRKLREAINLSSHRSKILKHCVALPFENQWARTKKLRAKILKAWLSNLRALRNLDQVKLTLYSYSTSKSSNSRNNELKKKLRSKHKFSQARPNKQWMRSQEKSKKISKRLAVTNPTAIMKASKAVQVRLVWTRRSMLSSEQARPTQMALSQWKRPSQCY